MNTQLTLDLGILTNEQQERVNYFIKSQNSTSERLTASEARTEQLLIEGGFKIGIDYINDFKSEIVTENKTFGYGENSFETEVTYRKTSGGCKIIYDQYNGIRNKIETTLYRVNNERGKLECLAVTSQYRAYKPSSLLQKLKENNEQAQKHFEKANATKSLLDYTVNKYKTLFPNASVTTGRDYTTYNRSISEFKVVKISFSSGSYIVFRLGYEKDKEYIHKKYDAVESKLTAIELLNIFNKQNISAS